MKAINLFTLLLLLLHWQAIGQKMAPEAVPKAVSEVFIKDFPGIMAAWEMSNGRYIATFEQNKYNMRTVYNSGGTRLETHVTIAEKELPENIREYVSHHSPNINEATKIIMANDHISFKVFAGAQYMEFDGKGNYLRTVNK